MGSGEHGTQHKGRGQLAHLGNPSSGRPTRPTPSGSWKWGVGGTVDDMAGRQRGVTCRDFVKERRNLTGARWGSRRRPSHPRLQHYTATADFGLNVPGNPLGHGKELVITMSGEHADLRCRVGVHLYVLGRADIPEERGHPYEQCARCGRRRELKDANDSLYKGGPEAASWPGPTGL